MAGTACLISVLLGAWVAGPRTSVLQMRKPGLVELQEYTLVHKPSSRIKDSKCAYTRADAHSWEGCALHSFTAHTSLATHTAASTIVARQKSMFQPWNLLPLKSLKNKSDLNPKRCSRNCEFLN